MGSWVYEACAQKREVAWFIHLGVTGAGSIARINEVTPEREYNEGRRE